MRYTRQILALLALAAGWMVLVADTALDPCQDFGPRENFEIQYEFQTNCMGTSANGLLDLSDDNETACALSHWGEGYTGTGVASSTLNAMRRQGLNAQRVIIIYKHHDDKFIPIGFDFEIKGEPIDAFITSRTFSCIDSRTHETLAVNKDYLCESRENPSETCELKLTYLPNE